MPSMKQCPQCGKYVAADRTYCMNCGVTLGIRCPDCRAVLPVGTKVCTACGHSFVKKKKLFHFALWDYLKKYPRPVLGLSLLVLLVGTLVTAALPSVLYHVLYQGNVILSGEVTGYELILYFLSGHPESITSILGERMFKDMAATLQALFFGEGVGLLVMLFGLVFSVLLAACNYRRMGRKTAKRLFAPLSTALGGAVIWFVLSLVTSSQLATELEVSYATTGWQVDTFALWPLVMMVLSAVVLLLHTILFIGVFRREDGKEQERALSQILSVPPAALGRLARRLVRHLGRRKRASAEKNPDKASFAVTSRFTTYLILLGVSLIFTQALLSKISHIFFWFVFLLPLVLLVYVLIAAHAMEVRLLSKTVTIEKNTPYTYEFHIHNRSILALPFVEAKVSIPQSNSVRCTSRLVRMSLAPLTGYHMKNTVRFRFRGTYDIGVDCLYVYDFFRMFRARVDVSSMITVYVLPRRLSLDETLAQAISDSTVRTVRSPLVVDKLEVSDIRDYQNGDPLKSIHWKLSSKAENFVVKDYNTGTANQTVVFCDMAPHFPDEPPGKKVATESKAEVQAPTRAERRAARSAEIKRRKAQQSEGARTAKDGRIKENQDTHAISDEELQARLDARAAAAEFADGRQGVRKNDNADTEGAPDATAAVEADTEVVDVHEPAQPAYYDDMNEYLADGVVELSIAMVLAELRQGHEVLLLWFDRRSDTGVFSYPLRSVTEFENIYHLFATAPLCEPRPVTSLTAMAEHIQSAKQLFVIPTLDARMLTDLTGLSALSDASNFGSTEVVLYNPEERFKYPQERASYLDACREQLAADGISLTVGSFNIAQPENPPEGGM